MSTSLFISKLFSDAIKPIQSNELYSINNIHIAKGKSSFLLWFNNPAAKDMPEYFKVFYNIGINKFMCYVMEVKGEYV